MSMFSKGDRVRCVQTWTTYVIDLGSEYTVEDVRPDNKTDTMEALVCGQWVPFSYFEKVEPEFVVGQQVSGDDYDRLPVQARAVDNNNDGITKTEDRWVTDTGKTCYPLHPRTLTHLPDATEPEDKDDLYVEPEPLKEGDADERIGAWERVADHPIFRPCYAEERPLIDAVMAKLDRIYSEGASPMRPEEPDVLGAVVYSESNGKFWTRASIDPEESHVWAGAYDKCWFNWRQLPDDVVVWDPADPARGGAS